MRRNCGDSRFEVLLEKDVSLSVLDARIDPIVRDDLAVARSARTEVSKRSLATKKRWERTRWCCG